jgi:hypothetical protein
MMDGVPFFFLNVRLVLVVLGFRLRSRIDLARVSESLQLGQLVFVRKFEITPIAH